mgnify:CR=1 FL=1
MSRTVVLVDAVRTPFGKAGGMYAGTRADDLLVRAIRGLLERNPKIDPASIEDVAIAAAQPNVLNLISEMTSLSSFPSLLFPLTFFTLM